MVTISIKRQQILRVWVQKKASMGSSMLGLEDPLMRGLLTGLVPGLGWLRMYPARIVSQSVSMWPLQYGSLQVVGHFISTSEI